MHFSLFEPLKERRDVILLSLIIPTIGFYFLGIMFLYIFQNRWDFTKKLAHNANRLDSDMKIVFNMLFYEGVHIDKTARNKPVKFLFTDYSRLSSVGGETSLAEMVGALTKTAERNFGIIPTRVYRHGCFLKKMSDFLKIQNSFNSNFQSYLNFCWISKIIHKNICCPKFFWS